MWYHILKNDGDRVNIFYEKNNIIQAEQSLEKKIIIKIDGKLEMLILSQTSVHGC